MKCADSTDRSRSTYIVIGILPHLLALPNRESPIDLACNAGLKASTMA
jgi:hypothetical protein